MADAYLLSTLFVLAMLLVGFALRATFGPLRYLFIPASVVGGLVGLGVMQLAVRQTVSPSLSDGFTSISNVIDGWPSLLIAVVFAGLLMERPGKKFSQAIVAASRQGIVVWIIVFGQAFVGLLACAFLIYPFFDVPPSFGQLIETGFAGGHGTAAAMGEVFDGLGFPQGRDLAFLFATAGLLYGVVSGIFFVNVGVRRGWLRGGPTDRESDRRRDTSRGSGVSETGDSVLPPESATGVAASEFKVPVVSGLEDRSDPKPSSLATVRSEVIDPLAFQLCLLGVAFGIGYLLQQLFLLGAGLIATEQQLGFVGKIPLFLFTLIGGWLTREAMHLLGVGDLIDGRSIARLVGISMEVLIVAALATLRLEAAADFLLPVLILLGVGFAWVAFCLLVVGRKLLPKSHWFELGLINYGMSTATTAQGMLLLRIVDRDLETDAASDYAAAAPLSAPFIGGGFITVLILPLTLERFGFVWVLPMMAMILIGLFAIGWQLRDRGTT